MRRYVFAAAILAAGLLAPRTGYAAERWVDRPMTLHQLVFAGDVGLGIGHFDYNVGPRPFKTDFTGVGLNLEGAIGITERLELGIRTGAAFGDDAKATRADYFGRTNQTETFDEGGRTFANPELRVKWVAYSGSVAEIGLDGRVYLPTDPNSDFGIMFGVPFAFHISDFMRIDLAVDLITTFGDHAHVGVSVPAYFWFQVNEKLWLGPMAAVRFANRNDPRFNDNDLLLGFGMGYQVARAVDLKWQFQAPAIDNGLHYYGAGFGVQFRIGE
jgi:hypothetical protein